LIASFALVCGFIAAGDAAAASTACLMGTLALVALFGWEGGGAAAAGGEADDGSVFLGTRNLSMEAALRKRAKKPQSFFSRQISLCSVPARAHRLQLAFGFRW
jgi:hypothetical protein